jgi:hypothetical protein
VQEIKDEENDQDGTETPAGAITPIPAMWPRGEGANQDEDQDDQEYGEHTLVSELPCDADAGER